MSVEVIGESRDCGGQHADGAVGVATGASAADLPRPPLEQAQVLCKRSSSGKVLRRVGDSAQSEDAWPALRGTLRGHVVQNSRGRRYSALVGAQEADDAGAERR